MTERRQSGGQGTQRAVGSGQGRGAPLLVSPLVVGTEEGQGGALLMMGLRDWHAP